MFVQGYFFSKMTKAIHDNNVLLLFNQFIHSAVHKHINLQYFKDLKTEAHQS